MHNLLAPELQVTAIATNCKSMNIILFHTRCVRCNHNSLCLGCSKYHFVSVIQFVCCLNITVIYIQCKQLPEVMQVVCWYCIRVIQCLEFVFIGQCLMALTVHPNTRAKIVIIKMQLRQVILFLKL